MFDLKIGVHNSSECYFGQITLFIDLMIFPIIKLPTFTLAYPEGG